MVSVFYVVDVLYVCFCIVECEEFEGSEKYYGLGLWKFVKMVVVFLLGEWVLLMKLNGSEFFFE